MLVTKLEQMNGKKWRVYLNDEPAFWLYSNEISGYHIAENEELTEALVEEIYGAVLSKRAKLRCMNLLKVMDKTEDHLRKKLLMEEYPGTVIDQAIEYVKSYHYVDDLRYAKNYIESKSDSKSRQQIQYELQNRGVGSELIEIAWAEAETVDETAQILRWAEKKHFDSETSDIKERKNIFQFLLRKGFLYSDIKKAFT